MFFQKDEVNSTEGNFTSTFNTSSEVNTPPEDENDLIFNSLKVYNINSLKLLFISIRLLLC